MSDPPLNEAALGAWLQAESAGVRAAVPVKANSRPASPIPPTRSAPRRAITCSAANRLEHCCPGARGRPRISLSHRRCIRSVFRYRGHWPICGDADVIGAIFYVMELARGRPYADGALPSSIRDPAPNVRPADRRARRLARDRSDNRGARGFRQAGQLFRASGGVFDPDDSPPPPPEAAGLVTAPDACADGSADVAPPPAVGLGVGLAAPPPPPPPPPPHAAASSETRREAARTAADVREGEGVTGSLADGGGGEVAVAMISSARRSRPARRGRQGWYSTPFDEGAAGFFGSAVPTRSRWERGLAPGTRRRARRRGGPAASGPRRSPCRPGPRPRRPRGSRGRRRAR